MATQELPPKLAQFLERAEEVVTRNGDRFMVARGGGFQHTIVCPAHDDRNPSLSVNWDNGKVLLDCKSGCETAEVLGALDLTWQDLEQPKRLVATYPYEDEEGTPLYEVLRYEPKAFSQRRSDPTGRGQWINNMNGVSPVPFNLPALAEALETGEPVYIVEGEKDVQVLWSAERVIGTCNHGGAGKWTDAHSEHFVGSTSHVTIVADRDKAGYLHALKVRESLLRVAAITADLVLPKAGKDTADHVSADCSVADFLPTTVDELVALKSADDQTAEADRQARIEAMAADLADREAAQGLHKQRKAAELAARDKRIRVMRGDEFMLDVPLTAPALIGSGTDVLAMKDEATLIVGGDGVGKSTLMEQIALARIGLRSDFLGFSVERAEGRVLYLAMDRPGQIRRSFARMVSETDRDALRERLVTWSGPLPIDPLSSPQALADWVREEFGSDISDVVADSYKDLAPGLAEDKPGAQLNLAMQEVLSRGMQWFGIHHQRKPSADRTHDYNLSDVYGSRWLTAGAGSVFMVLGDAGDSTVELRHVKQPVGVVGPLLVRHDHAHGFSTRVVAEATVESALMLAEGARMTVRDLCEAVYNDTTPPYRKRIERTLKRLLADEFSGVRAVAGRRGGSAGSTPAEYWFELIDTTRSTGKPKPRDQTPRGSK